MDELLRIAAFDKREEFKIFSGEVVRFGNRCKDPQWHNLDRYFESNFVDINWRDRLNSIRRELPALLIPQKQLKEEAETTMGHLKNLVQYTAELCHELQELDRREQIFRREQILENPNLSPPDPPLAILRAELKSQRKHVRSLQKKSLWSKSLEEVMEQLVDIVQFLHFEIHNAFGTADTQTPVKSNRQKLGAAGLALHYANIITQIDTLVTHSGSVSPHTRDSLYQGLPRNIKLAIRSNSHWFHLNEELTVPEIKGEMKKTLQWLVPIATNTTKAHHAFGWVGEWVNTGYEANREIPLRIETLHHADPKKTDEYILKLVIGLHHLVCSSKDINRGKKSPVKSPIRYRNWPDSPLSEEMLQDVSKRKPTLVISKSQNFDTRNRLSKQHRLTKSSSHSTTRELRWDPSFPIKRPSSVPIINFDVDRIKAMDVIDDIRA
ncbi:protein PSK SIMULATOR 1 isoform X2 [Helianthus annuus]|nr:protein PSK SIMULATOR 1 isoform X2 [Helianthus annuus]